MSYLYFVMSRTTLCGKQGLGIYVREMFTFRSRCQNVWMENDKKCSRRGYFRFVPVP